MIQFRNLTLSRGVRVLIRGLSLQIPPRWKVGLTGANGAGKSTLFALLRGQIHPDAGDLEIPPYWVIAHVAQETPALAISALDYTLEGDTELRQIETTLAELEQTPEHTEAEAAHIGTLHARLHEIGGYGARARAAALLDGLGFSQSDMVRPVSDFSGGWRMRLNLAQALMCRSDLLLLDEPTNHLDLDAVIWLEQWLRDYPGTLLLISHDREFLDAVTDHIAHIENTQLTLYTGGYSDFEQQRAARLALQQALFERQQRQIAHMEDYIRRFRAQATKARQAQSRIKALERMERISAAHIDTPFSFRFRPSPAAPDPLVRIEGGEVGYGSTPILKNLELTLRPGERIGLLGANGAGKSTLIKLLAQQLPLTAGEMHYGKGLLPGYFAQHQLETLREQDSPLMHLTRLAGNTREQDLRDYLGGFDFRGDGPGPGATTPCGPFSGGEKARLALALMIWQAPNLLLLDEPTNHLDLEMRHALTLALQDFDGAVVLVSHDRALLRATCDRFLLVDAGQVQPFEGDLDDYRDWLSQRRAQHASAQAQPQIQDKAARKEARENAAATRQAKLATRRPLLKEREQIERQLNGWQSEQKLLEARLADPAFYTQPNPDQLQTLTLRQAELTQNIETAEMRWLEIEETLETLGNVD